MQRHGHSAEVRISLSIGDRLFNVAQLGPDYLILRDASDHPPTVGEITLSIDGKVTRWPVELPDGIRAADDRTRTQFVPGSGVKRWGG